jgi:serine/threonine protein kinase
VDAGNLEPAEDGTLFFSMEFVDGPDLRSFLRDPQWRSVEDKTALIGHDFTARGKMPTESQEASGHDFSRAEMPLKNDGALAPEGSLPVELALHITRQIAEGLGAAHAKGMVHRDIKPENILMARDNGAWLPKIADFGIVATKESSTAYTRTGGTLLTMAYAAPEQWRGTAAAELDGRTDLYALGGLLYEMLTGQTPFHAENYEGWARQHQTTPPPPPSALRPDLANWRGLDALVLRLLAKDRNDRPKDVAELLAMLDTVRYELTAPSPATIVEPAPNHAPKPVPTISRSGIFKGVLAAILIVIALGIWAVVRFHPSTTPALNEVAQTLSHPAAVSTPTATKPSKSTSIIQAPVPGGGVNPAAQPGTIPNPNTNAATLLVMCDLACNWKLDGVMMGQINSGGSYKKVVVPGQHQVVAATEDGVDHANQISEVKAGGQTVVSIELMPIRDARLKTEQEAKDKATQDARDKVAREKQENEQKEREHVAQAEAAELIWIDPATRMMWKKMDNGSNVNWQQATDYCRNLQLAGLSNWRLATIDELQDIYDQNVKVGKYHVKGNLQLSGTQWSNSKGTASMEAWTFGFVGGRLDSINTINISSMRALCVRRSGE